MQKLEYITKQAKRAFHNAGTTQNSIFQRKYLKDQFDFFGIKSTERRLIEKEVMKDQKLSREELLLLCRGFMDEDQREFHYFALDLLEKNRKMLLEEDIEFITDILLKNSWWDTVDTTAVNILGYYLKAFPNKRLEVCENYNSTDNFWLRRSTIIFQLKYKNETDINLLESNIVENLHSKEFFINKAIGWALRQYSKTDSNWVLDFVNKYPLSNLSRREAVRLIK